MFIHWYKHYDMNISIFIPVNKHNINIPDLDDTMDRYQWFNSHFGRPKYPDWDKMGKIERRI